MEPDSSKVHLLVNKWEVKNGDTIVIINPKLHRGQLASPSHLSSVNANIRGLMLDPDVWGDDAEEFKPERMIGEKFSQLPKNCLKVSQIIRETECLELTE